MGTLGIPGDYIIMDVSKLNWMLASCWWWAGEGDALGASFAYLSLAVEFVENKERKAREVTTVKITYNSISSLQRSEAKVKIFTPVNKFAKACIATVVAAVAQYILGDPL